MRAEAWRRTTYVVAATQVFVLTGFGLALPFLPLYVQELGVHDQSAVAWWTGLLSGAAGFTMAFATPVWGAVGDRYGFKAMYLRAIVGGGLVLIGMGLVGDVTELLVLRFVQGALSGTVTASATLVAIVAPRSETGLAVGLVSAAVQVGNFLGPLFGGIAVVGLGFRWSFFVSGALLLASAAAAAVWVTETPADPDAPERATRSARDSLGQLVSSFGALARRELRGAVVAQFVTQLTFSSTLALFPLYAETLPRPPWLSLEVVVGVALAAGAVSAGVTTPVFGRYADRHGAVPVLVFGVLIGGLSLVLQAPAPNAVLVVALRALTGVAAAAVGASSVVLTRAAAPPGGEGRAFGATMSAQNFGWGFGPLLGAAVVATLGLSALFLIAGIATAAVALPALGAPAWFPRRASAATVED